MNRSRSRPARPYVSRGGEKLAAALDAFGIRVADRRALDAGASTGGFTDCLLRRDVSVVHAVDVGRGQLAWSVRNDPRVVVMERTNIRNLEPSALDAPVDLAVADLSFISLVTVAPALVRCTSPDADLVLLVKPQFEAGRSRVGKGGIVRDPAVHRRCSSRWSRASRMLALRSSTRSRHRSTAPTETASSSCTAVMSVRHWGQRSSR